jgi:hypothetical protein
MAQIMADIRRENPPTVGYADGGQIPPGGFDERLAIIAQMVQNGELDPEIAQELLSEAQGGSVLGGLGGAALGGYGGAKLGGMAAPGGIMGKAVGAGLGALAGGLGGYNAGPAAVGAAGATAAALSPSGRAFLGKAAPKAMEMGQEAAGVAGRTGDVISGLASQGVAKATPMAQDAAGVVSRTGDVVSGLASQGATRLTDDVLSPLSRQAGDAAGQAAHNVGLGIGTVKNKVDDLVGTTKAGGGELLNTAAEKLGSAAGATVQGVKNAGTKLAEAGRKAADAAKNPREAGQQGLAKVLAGIEEGKLTHTLNKSMKQIKGTNYRAPKLPAPKETALLDAVHGKGVPDNIMKLARQMLDADKNLTPAQVIEFLTPRIGTI